MSPKRLLLLGVLGLAVPSPARADDERAISAGFGYATFSTTGKATGKMAPPTLSPDVGGALSIAFERAFGSDFGFRAELAGGLFYGGIQDAKKQSNVSYAGLADIGGFVRFDVLKYVPYAFGGLGVVATGGGPIDGQRDVVIVVGGGLDVLASRAHSWGIEGRLASFGGDVTVFTLGLRGTTRWGFF